MKYKLMTRWISVILCILVASAAIVYFYISYQTQYHSGAKTELVDTKIFNPTTTPIAIVNAKVISPDCTKMLDSTTVLIKNGKIEKVGVNLSIPSEYTQIDGSGQFLMPGLIDAHTHLHRSKNDLLLYLANGITFIANMNSLPEFSYLDWRDEAKNGALSPQIYIAAGGMSTHKGMMAKVRTLFGSRNYNTPEQARKAVKKFKEQGYDAIKSYSPSREVYFAIMAEAERQNMPVTGHLPYDVGLEGLYSSWQQGVAHVEEITKNTFEDFGGRNYVFYDHIEEYMLYLEENADNIALNMKKKNMTVCSTSAYYEKALKQDLDLKSFLREIELEYTNPGILEGSQFRKGWLPGSNQFENPNNTSEEGVKYAKLYWENYFKAIKIMTKALVRNDVNLTTGSDSNGAGTVPGFSFLEQLESLERIGLTNPEILRAATVNAGKWMEKKVGKVEAGYDADLILLSENPLENISNTRQLNAVITQGKLLNRKELDKILKAVKDANNRSRKIPIDEYLD